jgi:hypothetical protein
VLGKGKGIYLITRYKKYIKNIRSNKDESAFAQHILNQGHQHGHREQIIKLIEYARKGNVMNIREDYYIYKFKQLNKLVEEQKVIKDSDNQNNIFDIALRHEYTPIVNVTRNRDINTLHSTPETSATTNNRKSSNSTTNKVGTT